MSLPKPPTTPQRKRQRTSSQDAISSSLPIHADIWKWVFTSDAIAPCFVKDVFSMKHNAVKDEDFYWLGRVPCRNVRLVGLVVGIQVYEKQIVYSIDDGTGVIDCKHQHRPPPPSPSKKTQGKAKVDTMKLPPLPKPMARMGTQVRLVGKVIPKFKFRQIVVGQIERCSSPNEEPRHWRTVLELHKSHYSSTEPFTIPVPTSSAQKIEEPLPPTIPTPMPQTPCSIASSPYHASSVTSSPTKSSVGLRSPQKLRHPSRLHSRDLTANTFRIYIKHYMDHILHTETQDFDSDTGYSSTTPLSTPTKSRTAQSRLISQSHLITPRKPADNCNSDRTPRPTRLIPITSPFPLSDADPDPDAEARAGFTMSYLRRVPELADMAKRVVKAEAKRRAREARKKAKEAATQGQDRPGTSKAKEPSQPGVDSGPVAPKMKRLFRWAIVQLVNEGSVVLWDGPVRSYTSSSFDPDGNGDRSSSTSTGFSGPWKFSSSASASSTFGADSTVSSSASTSRVTTIEDIDDPDDDEVSDPEPGEEAYIPLTPNHLAEEVEKVLRALMARLSRAQGKSSAQQQRQHQGSGAKGGISRETILASLRKDDRWRKVGEWALGDALDVLKDEGRAQEVSKGRWESCV